LDGAEGSFAPDAIYNELEASGGQGPDSIIQTLQGWKKAMTDSRGR
jgi:hypothetical protein